MTIEQSLVLCLVIATIIFCVITFVLTKKDNHKYIVSEYITIITSFILAVYVILRIIFDFN